MNKNEIRRKTKRDPDEIKANDYVYYFHLLLDGLILESGGDAKIVALYDEHWPKVKESIIKYYFSETADGVPAKPVPNYMFPLHENEEMYFGNDLYDIDEALNNEKRYEDRAAFARDCFELFDMYKGDGSPSFDYMNFSFSIGEALSDAGHIEESDAHYKKLLAEYPDNNDLIANYVQTLLRRGERAKAKELLEKHISLDIEPTDENEMLIESAIELYEEEGNRALARKYEELQIDIENSRVEPYFNSLINNNPCAPWLMPENTTYVRSEKKIYPNDPCPCGSGKKYKKCCGRN